MAPHWKSSISKEWRHLHLKLSLHCWKYSYLTIRANCKWSYKYLQQQNPLFEWPTKSNSGAKKANHGCLPVHIKELGFFLQSLKLSFHLSLPLFLDVTRPKMQCNIRLTKKDFLRKKIYYGWAIKLQNFLICRIMSSSWRIY